MKSTIHGTTSGAGTTRRSLWMTCPTTKGSTMYVKYGIDKREGCLVVCRPDQHVGYVGTLEDVEGFKEYFSGILISQARA
jgi:hypothetical protein